MTTGLSGLALAWSPRTTDIITSQCLNSPNNNQQNQKGQSDPNGTCLQVEQEKLHFYRENLMTVTDALQRSGDFIKSDDFSHSQPLCILHTIHPSSFFFLAYKYYKWANHYVNIEWLTLWRPCPFPLLQFVKLGIRVHVFLSVHLFRSFIRSVG